MKRSEKSLLRSLSFTCPTCLDSLSISVDDLVCRKCSAKFRITSSGKVYFNVLAVESISDSVDKFKHVLKRFNRLYRLTVDLVSPVYPARDLQRYLKSKDFDVELVVNLGSGSSNVSPHVINFDFLDYDHVDVLCSIEALPLGDDSVDAILNIAVLEHVSNPTKVVSEFFRILKPGGEVFAFVPFIQGFHASPWDFQRFTSSGLRELFKSFEILVLKPIGPTSGLLWIFQEWFAIAFSFGSKRLHMILWVFALALTWPLKFLDFFLNKNKMSENIASGFVIIASKKSI